MTYGDVNAMKDASELRRKYNLSPSDEAVDRYAGIDPSPKRPDEHEQAAD